MKQPSPMPAAEVSMSPEHVRQLLADQHPDLAGLPVEVLANGWDNFMCRLGDALVIRLPRRSAAAKLVEHEQRWLPVLAPRLPLRIPAHVRAGLPGLGYPWRWSVVPFLPGEMAAVTPPASAHDAAVSLGGFLGALHRPAPAGAPANPFRGIPIRQREQLLRQHLSLLGGLADEPAVLRAWEAAATAPAWDGAPVWLHGDLHPANILVSEGRVSAIIDFGDLTAGDPAGDLSVAWMLLPPGSHGAFRDAYEAANGHGADAGTWSRARGWAVVLSVSFLANSADNPMMARISERTISAVLG